jgi:hypothetical protein
MSREELAALCKSFLVEGYHGDYLENEGYDLAREVERLTIERLRSSGGAREQAEEMRAAARAEPQGIHVELTNGQWFRSSNNDFKPQAVWNIDEARRVRTWLDTVLPEAASSGEPSVKPDAVELRRQLRVLANLWQQATIYQRSTDGTQHRTGDAYHADALVLENKIIAMCTSGEPGATQDPRIEIDFLEQWLQFSAMPIGQECCNRPGSECCGSPNPVYPSMNDVLEAMNKRRSELVLSLTKSEKL